jgi:hypothetical protein
MFDLLPKNRTVDDLQFPQIRGPLEEENLKLKKIVADLSLAKHMLQEVLSKKV